MKSSEQALRVLFAAAEVTPMAKVGGLGDVIGALPKALAARDIDVRLVLPRYREIDPARYPTTDTKMRFSVSFDGIEHTVRVFLTTLPGSAVPVYLLDHPHYESAGDIYFQHSAGKEMEQLLAERFLFYSASVAQFVKSSPWQPDIVHCHDWHSAATLFLLQKKHCTMPTVFTIHNIASVGVVTPDRWRELLGMNAPFVRDSNNVSKSSSEFFGAPHVTSSAAVNITDVALRTATVVSTVSPSYAKEILTPEFGMGFEKILQSRSGPPVGIVNGIDTVTFDPALDQHIPYHYNKESLEEKKKNTAALKQQFRLRGTGAVLGMVARLTEQKGVELLVEAAQHCVDRDMNIVVLGTGEPRYETLVRDMAVRFPTHIAAITRFDADIAQLIYAGSDMFAMPSKFEPCGLGQLIAMRYGTIPIVHAVGGLRDTVQEGVNGTGFVFEEFSLAAFLATLDRALSLFADPPQWSTLQQRAMGVDVSWEKSAELYAQLYIQTLAQHGKK